MELSPHVEKVLELFSPWNAGDVKSSSGKIELNDLKEAFEDAKVWKLF